jgi:hypothetical protein
MNTPSPNQNQKGKHKGQTEGEAKKNKSPTLYLLLTIYIIFFSFFLLIFKLRGKKNSVEENESRFNQNVGIRNGSRIFGGEGVVDPRHLDSHSPHQTI